MAQFYFDSIQTKTTRFEVEKALVSLSAGHNTYKYVYQDIMDRINNQVIEFKQLAHQVLSWIVCAKRPLTTRELQHALAVEVGESELNDCKLPEIEDMVTVCAGLVTVDEGSGIIRLIHYTTQEYFEQTRTSWFPKAEVEITKICITYLSFRVFEGGFCETSSEFEDRLQRNPLYDYAARNWGYHACLALTEVERFVKAFLNLEIKVSSSSQAMMATRVDGYPHELRHVPKRVRGVHLAAYFGLLETMIALLKDQDGLEAQDTRDWTPLFYAVHNDQEAMVKLLLEKGANLNINDGGFVHHSLLLYAVSKGYEGIVKLLLEKGANLEYKDGLDGQTPLSYAAMHGKVALVKLLLEKGADMESRRTLGRTALYDAADRGCKRTVELLVERGAELETKSSTGRTALYIAAESGYDDVTQLLVDKGAEIETKSSTGRTPLLAAAESGHELVTKLLLDKGADPVSKSTTGETPLDCATKLGHEGIVKLLLERGADPTPGCPKRKRKRGK